MILTLLLSFSGLLVIFLISAILVLYFYFKKQYKYWGEKNIPHAKPVFPFGNLNGIQKEAISTFFQKFYEESKHEKYYGLWFLQKPTLLIKDPDLIKKIFVENFANFHGHGTYVAAENGPESVNLFTLDGEAWKDLRAKLSPTLTSGKLRKMVSHMKKCYQDVQDVLSESAKINDVIDVKEFTSRFITDVLLSLVFGIESNCVKNPGSETGKMVERALKPNKIAALKLLIAVLMPDLAKRIKQSILSKEILTYFSGIVNEVLEYRKKNNIQRDDIMQSLIDLMRKESVDNDFSSSSESKKSDGEHKFTFEILVIQAITFLLGGHDTSVALIAFALFELAGNIQIQNKLRKEIKAVLYKHNEQLSYEAINEMEYLGRVVDETLRKYPTFSNVQRECSNDFKDPVSGLSVKKGTFVLIPIYCLHHDKKYFPNPEKFEPDRFLQENKSLRPNYTYLPFGEGPRICFGQKIALLQIKVGLIAMLSKFQFEISETFSHIPLEVGPKSIVMSPKGKVMLKISPV